MSPFEKLTRKRVDPTDGVIVEEDFIIEVDKYGFNVTNNDNNGKTPREYYESNRAEFDRKYAEQQRATEELNEKIERWRKKGGL